MTELDGRWAVDPPRSSLAFSVRHLGLARVHGSFGAFEGTLELAGGIGTAQGSVRAESVQTGDALRDRMLRGADFFDAGSHPLIELRAGSLDVRNPGRAELSGQLSMAGETRPLRLALTAEQSSSAKELRLTGSVELRRSDFGLHFRGAMAAGDKTVGDRVGVELAMVLVSSE